ncbi:hypothetical protein [Demequina maris]|uniref:hypothetical protein n=1 Tax=Demequina maris TaxID=1638982 RepID=UPI0007812419|nr:hypothetical protein [Demequina maris]
METTQLTAKLFPSDGWWSTEVVAVRGFFAQAKRLDQVEATVKDAAALYFDLPETDFDVVFEVEPGG